MKRRQRAGSSASICRLAAFALAFAGPVGAASAQTAGRLDAQSDANDAMNDAMFATPNTATPTKTLVERAGRRLRAMADGGRPQDGLAVLMASSPERLAPAREVEDGRASLGGPILAFDQGSEWQVNDR
jgi:hypothetical protein